MAHLRRTRNAIFGGVCGGIADWLGWDATLVRVLYVLISIFSAAFLGIIVYVILWIVMPKA
jgi:phage shock protein PspC (stress-responsive transcriptional regulator)